jgi:PLP dependent protein
MSAIFVPSGQSASISASIDAIQAKILRAAQRTGRDFSEIRLIAVSKTFPADAVSAAIGTGQRVFGENRTEEAVPKLIEIGTRHPDVACEWHLIGHLQSRKARDAARHFALIHSVDSVKLAAKIDAQSVEPQQILLQCNVSGEESKEGFALSDAASWPAFFDTVAQLRALPNLRIRGLMTLAPIVPDPELARPSFAALRTLRDALRRQFPDDAHCAWNELSMGMTDDFEAAIAEGATYVRIGRAIFGAR